MRKIFIILCLVFLLFTSACKIDDIITEEVIEEIITNTDKENKIFINVIKKNTLQIPLEHKGIEIKWEYDKNFLSLKENEITVSKNGTTILKATYNDKPHLYSITVKNLTITSTVQYNIPFYYSFITDSKKIGKNINPKKIVFHNTGNTASAENEIKWLSSKDNTSSTSFHFAVDDIGIYQAIPTTNAGYHAGNLAINNQSIGIEIAKSLIDDEIKKDSAITNATILISLLMNYYIIEIENVITHQDASGKYCPHDIFDRYGLDKFYKEIKTLI